MRVTLRFFASIREQVGQGSEEIDTPALTVGALRDELLARGGAYAECLSRQRPVRVAVNQVLSEESALLVDGAEVAFFPPVTGG